MSCAGGWALAASLQTDSCFRDSSDWLVRLFVLAGCGEERGGIPLAGSALMSPEQGGIPLSGSALLSPSLPRSLCVAAGRRWGQTA